MTKNEMKKEFKERFARLYPNCRLLAIQLDGFTHNVYFDNLSPRAKVIKGGCHCEHYSSYLFSCEADDITNNERVTKLFEGFPNSFYQYNAMEIVYVNP